MKLTTRGGAYLTDTAMEQESDAVAAVVEDRATGSSGEVVAEGTHTPPPDTTVTAVTDHDDAWTATGRGEDLSTQAQEICSEEIAVARSDKRKKSYRPSLEVVEVKVDLFYDKAVFKRGLQVGMTRIRCLVPGTSVEATEYGRVGDL